MSDAPRLLPQKKEVALALLEESSLFVHLDPRRSGVMVPKWFTGQPQLVLQLGLNMAIAITDLKVDDEAITCTLSFNRAPFWCSLPWSAVYALVGEDGRGMVWPEDVPPEVAQQMQKQQATPPPASAKPGVARKSRAKLAAVDGNGEPQPRRRGREDAKPPEKESRRGLESVSAGPPVAIGPQAVPNAGSSAAQGGPRPVALRNAEEGDKGSPAPPPVRAAPSSGAKKPKRELPPYLRVIK